MKAMTHAKRGELSMNCHKCKAKHLSKFLCHSLVITLKAERNSEYEKSFKCIYMWHWQGIYCAKKSAFFAYLKHPKFSQSRTLGKKTFGCYREKLLPRLISHIFPPHSFPPMPPQPSVYQRPYIFRTPVF